jgi:hypothetical protein
MKATRDWARRNERRGTRENASAARDARVLRKIQREAKEHGATLENGGKGGLPPLRALKAFRKSGWRCENKKCPTPRKDLTLDHESGHPKEIMEDPEARKDPGDRKAARSKDPKDDRYLRVLCAKCHTGPRGVHARENAIEDGKKPPPMRGDDR